jgi:hypothetical protein
MKPSMLDAALDYAKRDFAVFPCSKKIPCIKKEDGGNGFKDATRDEAQIREWWAKWPNAQVGLPTGRRNNLFVLDLDSQQAQEHAKQWNLPETFTVETRPGRKQLWFRQPAELETKCSAEVLAPKIDTRGDGGYVIAPPSIHHETRAAYRVVKDVPYADASLLPTFILRSEATGANGNGASPKVTGDKIPRGSHDAELTRIAGKLRHDGIEENLITAALIEVCEKRCEDYGRDYKQMCGKIARSVCHYEPGRRKIKAPPPEIRVELERYSMVEKEHLEYLWPGYLPIGKLAHLAGKSGEGKSPVTISLAAACSTGNPWPDGTPNTHGPRDVILLAAEDDPHDTIRPRLDLAGADVERVHRAKCTVKTEQSVSEKLFALSSDLALLIATARTLPELALIVIDPITNYLGGGVKMNSEEEVRALLMPLALAAAELKILALTVGHLNRRERGTESLDRIMGAAAFSGVARFIYLVGPDPEDMDPHAHVFVQRRGVDAPSLRYKTFLKEETWDGKTSGVIGVEWRGVSKATSEDAVDPQIGSNKSAERQAAKDLAEILKDGRKSSDEAKKALSALGHDVEKINVTRLLFFAGASSQRFTNERYYSWFLPSKTTA